MKIVYRTFPIVSRSHKENAAHLMYLKSSLGLKPLEVMCLRKKVDDSGNRYEQVDFYFTRHSLVQIRELLLSTEEMRDFVVGVAFAAQAYETAQLADSYELFL